MALYEVRGTVTVTGTVVVERDRLTNEDARRVLADELAGFGAREVRRAVSRCADVKVEYTGETDGIDAARRSKD